MNHNLFLISLFQPEPTAHCFTVSSERRLSVCDSWHTHNHVDRSVPECYSHSTDTVAPSSTKPPRRVSRHRRTSTRTKTVTPLLLKMRSRCSSKTRARLIFLDQKVKSPCDYVRTEHVLVLGQKKQRFQFNFKCGRLRSNATTCRYMEVMPHQLFSFCSQLRL